MNGRSEILLRSKSHYKKSDDLDEFSLDLLKSISQLKTLSNELIDKIDREISLLDIPWKKVYFEYQNSGWKTVSLMNQSGESSDVIVSDGKAIETKILKSLPQLATYLRDLDLSYMCVRLAKLEPNSFLWEHRDYTELQDKPRLRLHIPIQTNDNCHMILSGRKFHLKRGYLWKLNPQVSHGVCNTGKTSRIHVILDCYIDSEIKLLVKDNWLDQSTSLPFHVSAKNSTSDEEAMKLAKLQFYKSAERVLLKTYHKQSQSEGGCYDRIIKMYDKLNFNEKSVEWKNKKIKFLGLEGEV